MSDCRWDGGGVGRAKQGAALGHVSAPSGGREFCSWVELGSAPVVAAVLQLGGAGLSTRCDDLPGCLMLFCVLHFMSQFFDVNVYFVMLWVELGS